MEKKYLRGLSTIGQIKILVALNFYCHRTSRKGWKKRQGTVRKNTETKKLKCKYC